MFLLTLLTPEKLIIYHSQREQAMDDFLYGGAMFEEGFVTKYIITDLLLFLVIVAAILVGSALIRRKR